jgi:hypothetical protein
MNVTPEVRASVSKIERRETGMRKSTFSFSAELLSLTGDSTAVSAGFSVFAGGASRALASAAMVLLRGS